MMGVKPPREGTSAHSQAEEVPLSVFHCRADDGSALVTPMNAAMFNQVHSVGFSLLPSPRDALVSPSLVPLAFSVTAGTAPPTWV